MNNRKTNIREYMQIKGSRYTPPREIFPPPRFSVATLFRFVARFALVRIEDYSRNWFTSTAYFIKPGTFRGGNIPVTKLS